MSSFFPAPVRATLLRSILSMAIITPAYAASSFGSGAISNKAFNPATSLILNGQFSAFSNAAETRDVPGFQLGDEAGGFTEGFTLNESELNLQANIDDKFYAASTISFGYDAGQTSVSVEEAFFQTLTLPYGLQVKGGKFLSGIGYINGIHSHATSFVGDPLAYRVFFNGRLSDPGVQVTWTAPTITYIQLGAELFSGDSFPSAGATHGGVGTRTLFARAGGDVDDSNSWLAGISWVNAHAIDRPSGGTTDTGVVDPLFTGKSNTWVASLVWKWAPHGNTREQNVHVTAEYMDRREDGNVSLPTDTGDYRANQHGYYVEGVYQFRPQWSVGVRIGAVDAKNAVGLTTPNLLAQNGFNPRNASAMLSFKNSEFSTLRLQFNRDESNPVPDNQVILQYIMAMGAHGAHSF